MLRVTIKVDEHTKVALRTIGEHIRETRTDHAVSQASLAKKLKMDPANLGKLERGERNVTIDTLVRIAACLGVDLVIRFEEKSEPAV